MKTTLILFALLTQACSLGYENYLQMSTGPARAEEAIEKAWSFYNRTDDRQFHVHWVLKGDCLKGDGFVDRSNSHDCIAGEYDPLTNDLYVMDIARTKWGNGSLKAFGREDHLCHEILHAVIDHENGVIVDGDAHHHDFRWFNYPDGTIGEEQMCSVMLTQMGFGDEAPGAAL